LRDAIFLAVILAIALALGSWRESGAEYPAHCYGVDAGEALYLVQRMNEARVSHEYWALPENNTAWSGSPEWHLGWVDTYWRVNNLIALTLRGCV